ncbi:hypothetical protein Barb4_01624 [Bacteroidales bacterium Barb4]|nr:hypothetical protein Barb4_01624 [Bacteroidales bacterium Barb4]
MSFRKSKNDSFKVAGTSASLKTAVSRLRSFCKSEPLTGFETLLGVRLLFQGICVTSVIAK